MNGGEVFAPLLHLHEGLNRREGRTGQSSVVGWRAISKEEDTGLREVSTKKNLYWGEGTFRYIESQTKGEELYMKGDVEEGKKEGKSLLVSMLYHNQSATYRSRTKK